MALLTESGDPLLTESGLSLRAEGETDSLINDHLTGRVTLRLSSQATLTVLTVYVPIPLVAQATLRLFATATLHKFRVLRPNTATLRLTAQHQTPIAPPGLQAQMKVLTDPDQPDAILDQYLLVWFVGSPTLTRISLQLDDGAAFEPACNWQNPGTQTPAILRIDGAEIPGDGQRHQIKISVWQQADGRTSPRATLNLYGKTPIPPIPQPEWVNATLLRQASTTMADLTRIEWRHTGAVKIQAVVGPVGHKKIYITVTVGYADHHESELFATGLCEYCGSSGFELVPVKFGVAGIGYGQFSPPRWVDRVVSIRDYAQIADEPTLTPDQISGIAKTIAGYTNETVIVYDAFAQAIRTELLAQFGVLPANGDTLIVKTISRLIRKIKDIIRKGGNVTLDDLGRFEARWNEAYTVRSIAFVPSAGFKEGTRQGRWMTDAEAKART